MLSRYHDELICDFAETYHIYDIRQFKPGYIAVLAHGLRADSRVKMAVMQAKDVPQMAVLSGMLDRLSWLVWAETKDAAKNRNRPKSVYEMIFGSSDSKDKVQGFDTSDEFELARAKILYGR